MLTSHDPAAERILALGLYGSGKTKSWADIAKWYRTSGTPGMFYVLDTDNTTLRTLTGYEGWEQNVVRQDVPDWETLTALTDEFFAKATQDDWLVIDSIDQAWTGVQDYYTEQVFGKDSADFFLQAKLAGQSGHPLADGFGQNWQVINKLYQRWVGKVIRWPGHVYACTPSQAVVEPNASGKGGDSREIRETFGRYGVRPAGQKALGFQFHTVLLMQSPSRDEWKITSVKDRSRELLVGAPNLDFVVSYLLPVGGWEISE
jgi:hypothetical protein